MQKSQLQLTKNKPKSTQYAKPKQATDDTAPIDQPRRLSLRRPSFKREIIENESFIDIRLKPVARDKATPQNAEQKQSQLTKVTHNCVYSLYLFI